MRYFVEALPDGRIRNRVVIKDSDTPPAGMTEVDESVRPATHYLSGGTAIAYTAEARARLAAWPTYPATWDMATKSWVNARPLDQLKTLKWRVIKRAAQEAAVGGFIAGGFDWDSDLDTQLRMQLKWQDINEADGPSTVTWRTAAGVPKTLTKAQFKALARAMMSHLEAQQDKATTLRAQIQAATTPAEVAAVSW